MGKTTVEAGQHVQVRSWDECDPPAGWIAGQVERVADGLVTVRVETPGGDRLVDLPEGGRGATWRTID